MQQKQSVEALDQGRARVRGETLARMVDLPTRLDGDLADGAPRARRRLHPRRETYMDRARKDLPVVVYLAPNQLPNADAIIAALGEGGRRRCLQALMSADFDLALATLTTMTPAPGERRPQDLAGMIETGEPANLEVHDAFFNIARAGHDHPAQLIKSQFEALAALRADLAEAPSSLEDAGLATLDLGLRAGLAAMLGAPAPGSFPPARRHAGPGFEDAVCRRWIRGHQIFTALSQGLIFAVAAFAAADAREDRAGLASAADLIAVLMDACGHALAFTGDFEGDAYERLIRPNMAPPHQPDGFSGLLSADHRELVFGLKANRPAMERFRAADPGRHARIVDALAGVYDQHKHVCARFVGADRASLLMAPERGRSGVEQLERFKTARLRNLGPKADHGAA
jgi:hypothetical protein